MRLQRAITGISLLLFSTLQGLAADPSQGAAIAERWCSGCHVVSSGQKQGTPDAPPFSEIAEREDLNPSKVALFLLLPHPPMADINLSRTDAADLAAYITTQKGK